MKYNKAIMKIAVCVLACCLIIPLCLTGCSGNGKTLMSLDGHNFSVNYYQLMLTQQKGSMANWINSNYGNYNSEKFWGMTVDIETQKTNADYYEELVLERAKNYLAALALFDELEKTKSDFDFPKAYEESIKASIQNMIENDAGGSKTKLNSILSEYGINMKMLESFLIMDAKSAYVMDYVYGSDGSKISADVKELYYKEHYVSCREIVIQKFAYVYETDEDGTEIYYDSETGYPIYDTTKTPKFNTDGTSVTDKVGNRIYYDDNGKIAYDKVKGVRRVLTDEFSGAVITQTFSDEKINTLREKAKMLAVDADGKGLNYFESLRIENSDGYLSTDETNGNMFFDVRTNYSSYTSEIFDDITDSLETMKVGDVKLVEDDLSFTIIIKTDLESGAWNEEKYDESFNVLNDFVGSLIVDLYSAKLAPYRDRIEINDKVFDSIDFGIVSVSPNYYYPDPDTAYYLYETDN